MTELCQLALKYGSDKAIFLTPYYHELLGARREGIFRVLEIGIGYADTMLDSLSRIHVDSYTTGASLYMWQEYFPQAEIVGWDKQPGTFIEDERISTFYCDQSCEKSIHTTLLAMQGLSRTAGGFDLIIDDGSHQPEHQMLTAQLLVPYLNPGGIYIVEDVNEPIDELSERIGYKAESKRFVREDLNFEHLRQYSDPSPLGCEHDPEAKDVEGRECECPRWDGEPATDEEMQERYGNMSILVIQG